MARGKQCKKDYVRISNLSFGLWKGHPGKDEVCGGGNCQSPSARGTSQESCRIACVALIRSSKKKLGLFNTIDKMFI